MKLNYKRTFLVGLAFFAICSFWQLYDHIIPLILKYTFLIPDGWAGIVMATDNVLALFLLPLFGFLSDRTRTRWGKRMPYIVVGSIGGAATLLLLPIADKSNSFILFMLGLALALLFMASYRSPAVALMPDVTIKPLRSKGNAVINLMGAFGGMVILGLVGAMLPGEVEGATYRPDYMPIFLVCALIMLASTLLLILFVKEPKFAAQMQQDTQRYHLEDAEPETEATEKGGGALPKGAWLSMILLLASVALWFMGYNAVTTAFSKYCVERFSLSAGSSAQILLVANAAAVVSYLPVGIIATKVGRRKCVLFGVALLFAAFAVAALQTTFHPGMYALFVLAGVGWATINVNSYPMVVEMAKGTSVGTFTGFYYTASMLAQTITPILSGNMLQYWGYMWLFPYGALFVGLSFVTMLFVRHGDAKPLPPASALESFEAMDD